MTFRENKIFIVHRDMQYGMYFKSVIVRIFGILLMTLSLTANATTVVDLQKTGKLKIKTWIEPGKNIIARQQVDLHIEIATDKWFRGGTRIGRFEIEDAIVLQRDSFALNSTRNEGGKTWTLQQWTLAIYPQREGRFFIPAIPVNVSIAGENLDAIVGRLMSKPINFNTVIPDELQGKDNWVATRRYTVKSSFNKSIETLKAGDALIRSIHFSADDLPAMMLPTVNVEDISGIAIYQKPTRITDKVNRGDYLAERFETLTYVFEQAGEYRLPPQSYDWWNLESGALEVIELAATPLRVTGPLSTKDAAGDNVVFSNEKESIDVRSLLLKFTLVIIVLLAVWVVIRRVVCYLKAKQPEKSAMSSERDLHTKFEQACQDRDLSKAIQLFYQWLDLYTGESFRGSVRRRISELGQTRTMHEFNTIMRSIYSSELQHKVELHRFAHQFIGELKKTHRPSGVSRWAVEFRLN